MRHSWHLREFGQELGQRFALAFSNLSNTVKRIEGHSFAVVENAAQARHPVGTVSEDQMTNDVERSLGFAAFIAMGPKLGQAA
jgi:hypothetical protein